MITFQGYDYEVRLFTDILIDPTTYVLSNSGIFKMFGLRTKNLNLKIFEGYCWMV